MHHEHEGTTKGSLAIGQVEAPGFSQLLATDEFRGLYKQDMASSAHLEHVGPTWRTLMGMAVAWGTLTTIFAASGICTESGLIAALRQLPMAFGMNGF